ncbi:ABC transporter substrate binding protein [Pseudomonas aegrilactucae]|uniref:ABC transporter substrate-binding protein n=1 Tax=Pseudomonas aegrilactucae TaxID=2854028 RepID=A0A9Q2XJD5_9PSED|nr:ABC transporter substrate binding protein [Pseudomonas aegrilactucae]MBV6288142.1 ABC transporter substrate-binding protein [Pseudomonas aegrilactucae]
MRLLQRCLLLMLMWPLTALSAGDIVLTAAQDTASVRGFVQALRQQRPADRVRFVPVAELPAPVRLAPATRLVLLDTAALDWRLSQADGPPALALRITRVQAERRLGGVRPAYLSLLWSDPPLARQLRLTHYLLPQARRIGVLYAEHSSFLLEELRQAARPLGLKIVAQAWPDPRDNRPLQAVLKNSDVLLGLDDLQLYNPHTAKNLLLSSYARQVPLIGPNAGFVRAGGLASTLSDQQDWLAVLTRLLDQPPAQWPRERYPEHFRVTGNRQVARALGIEAIDPAAAQQAVAAGEIHP